MARSDLITISNKFGWHLYVLTEEGGEYSKIGTATNVKYRLAGLQNGNPRRLRIVGIWHLESRDAAFKVEIAALCRLGVARLKGRDWVKCEGEEARAAVLSVFRKLGIRAEASS